MPAHFLARKIENISQIFETKKHAFVACLVFFVRVEIFALCNQKFICSNYFVAESSVVGSSFNAFS